MTLDHCPHGYYRGWRNGSCAVCYIPPHRQAQTPRSPRIRDAAIWSAFVHELRAELALAECAELREDVDIHAECDRVKMEALCEQDREIARLRAMVDARPEISAEDADLWRQFDSAAALRVVSALTDHARKAARRG